MNSKAIRFFLFLGLLGAIIVGIGEYLLHFLPGGPGGEVAMLEDVPIKRASKGHFFSVIGVPLYTLLAIMVYVFFLVKRMSVLPTFCLY